MASISRDALIGEIRARFPEDAKIVGFKVQADLNKSRRTIEQPWAHRWNISKRSPKAKGLTQQHLCKHPEKLKRFNKVRIWSNEWRMWWRPKGNGYTDDVDQAGIYPADDAWQRVSGCGPEKKIVLYSVD